MVDHCVQVYDPVLLLAVVNGSLWLKKKTSMASMVNWILEQTIANFKMKNVSHCVSQSHMRSRQCQAQGQ